MKIDLKFISNLSNIDTIFVRITPCVSLKCSEVTGLRNIKNKVLGSLISHDGCGNCASSVLVTDVNQEVRGVRMSNVRRSGAGSNITRFWSDIYIYIYIYIYIHSLVFSP